MAAGVVTPSTILSMDDVAILEMICVPVAVYRPSINVVIGPIAVA